MVNYKNLIICLILLDLVVLSNMFKPLILYFDINGTITIYDSLELSENTRQHANLVLSKSTFGQVINGTWSINENQSTISYYNYLKSYHPKDIVNLSNIFTEIGQPGTSLKNVCDQVVNIVSTNGLIFPSFIKVLDKYPMAKLIFRTFGPDGDLIINELKHKYGFKNEPIKGIIEHSNNQIILRINGSEYTGLSAINDFLIQSENQFMLIRDDYYYWKNHNRNANYGKPFVINPTHDQLFFDDNDCVVAYDSNGQMMTNSSHFIKINSIKAQLDVEYFVNHIQQKLMANQI